MCVEIKYAFEEKVVDDERLCFRVPVSISVNTKAILHDSNTA